MRFACCAVLAVLPFCLQAAVVVPDDSAADNRLAAGEPSSADAGSWATVVGSVTNECAKEKNSYACASVKIATALDRATRMSRNVQVFPGLTVAKNPEYKERDSRAVDETELTRQLQPESPDYATRVTDMLVNSGVRFLQSRTLQFSLPPAGSEVYEEGRAKLKKLKGYAPYLGLLAVKIAAVLPFLLGIIGFFALKALVLGKLALLIAGVMAFQKYAGSTGGFGKIAENFSSANVAGGWSQPAAPSTNGGYYRRSMEQAAAQQMAYNGQMQPSVQTAA